MSPTRVRQLLQDGELDGERDGAGHWLIPARVVHERLERLRRESFVEAVGYDPSIVHAMQERVEVLRDQVEMLRVELKEAHAANRENRRIIAALTSRIPELPPPAKEEPPQEPPGEPTAATPQPGRVGPQPPLEAAQEPSEPPEMAADEQQGRGPVPDAGGPQEGAERVSWWRRMFGG